MHKDKLFLLALTANALSACSSPPKLSEPKGNWVSFEPTTMQTPAATNTINAVSQTLINVPILRQPKIITPKAPHGSDKTLLVLSNGRNEPLYKSVRAVVPASWLIQLSPEVAQNYRGKVSWTGNDQWPYVLRRMLAREGLKASINDLNKEVVINFATPTGKPVSPVLTTDNKLAKDKTVQAPDTPKEINVSHSPLIPKVMLPLVPEKLKLVINPQPVLKNWKIDKSPSLIKSFEEWVSKDKCPSMNGKWRIRKETDNDYPVDYPLSFLSENLEDATRQLFELYKNAPAPIYVTGYPIQCLIVISDQK